MTLIFSGPISESNDVEFGLLGGRRRGGARSGGHHRDRCGGGDAVFFLELLDEIRELENGELVDLFD